MMYPVKEIKNLEDFLIDAYDKCVIFHGEKILDTYNYLWFEPRDRPNYLIFIRKYANSLPFNWKNPYEVITNWIKISKISKDDYIEIIEFGNGIKFQVFTDPLGVMKYGFTDLIKVVEE